MGSGLSESISFFPARYRSSIAPSSSNNASDPTAVNLRKAIASAQNQVKTDFSLAYAHNQMGCAWMMAGDYQKGCELFREALRIWKSNPMYTKGIASMEYANLGLSYWLLGQLDEASGTLEEGLKEREEGFGIDNPESFRYTAMRSPHLPWIWPLTYTCW